eukprot:scaffold107645_cov36-Phaeocystis_antarctica.AAC.1
MYPPTDPPDGWARAHTHAYTWKCTWACACACACGGGGAPIEPVDELEVLCVGGAHMQPEPLHHLGDGERLLPLALGDTKQPEQRRLPPQRTRGDCHRRAARVVAPGLGCLLGFGLGLGLEPDLLAAPAPAACAP